MTSGFSLSDMATEGGCWVKVATGGGAGRGSASVRSMGASCATEALGVMGDTGGRLGDADSERLRERAETDDDEASLDEAGRGFVSTRSAGMAAGWATFSRRRAREASQIADRWVRVTSWRRQDWSLRGPRVGSQICPETGANSLLQCYTMVAAAGWRYRDSCSLGACRNRCAVRGGRRTAVSSSPRSARAQPMCWDCVERAWDRSQDAAKAKASRGRGSIARLDSLHLVNLTADQEPPCAIGHAARH